MHARAVTQTRAHTPHPHILIYNHSYIFICVCVCMHVGVCVHTFVHSNICCLNVHVFVSAEAAADKYSGEVQWLLECLRTCQVTWRIASRPPHWETQNEIVTFSCTRSTSGTTIFACSLETNFFLRNAGFGATATIFFLDHSQNAGSQESKRFSAAAETAV